MNKGRRIAYVVAGVALAGVCMAESLSPGEEEARVEQLLGKMTREEKMALCHGNSKFNTAGIPRLGIPRIAMSDGPHGVRRETEEHSWGPVGREDDHVTYLPTGFSLAATWNPELGRLFGETLGEEARHRGKDILLGPGVNIVRTPLCGRNFEYLGEDPYLAGRMGAEVVQGIQSRGVAACVKHYALNNQEWDRSGVNVVADERTLREIYLPAFEAAVRAGVWTVMGAYNRFRGAWCCENGYLVRDILKGEWGFDGIYLSDWGAVHSTHASAWNGLDIEMGTSDDYETYYFAGPLREAIERGEIPIEVIDDKVRRILRVMIRAGALDPDTRPGGLRNTTAHQRAARDIAAESIVLLKNDGLLPLDVHTVLNLVVIGENAARRHGGEGGSSAIRALYEVTPLEGFARRGGDMVKITHVEGYRDGGEEGGFPPVGEGCLQTFDPQSGLPGWKAEYYGNKDLSGAPVAVVYEKGVRHEWGGGAPVTGVGGDGFSARWTAEIRPAASGVHRIGLASDDGSRLRIDGRTVIDHWRDHGKAWKSATIELEAGKTYRFEVEYYESGGEAAVELGWIAPDSPSGKTGTGWEDALAAARAADAVLIVGGLNHARETEGVDRADLRLPGGQNEWIEAVAAVNPRTVVILVCGSAVEMPWIDRVSAVVQMGYAGMEGGHALADVVFGDVNPSGKLPVTFPRRLEDSPAHAIGQYTDGDCEYRDGLLVGYRGYDTRRVEPLFPFGHGLSYTEFAYRNLRIDPKTLEVSLEVQNTGLRRGREVVQLYVQARKSRLPRPDKELKQFAKVELDPGETRRISLPLEERSLAFYDPARRQWAAEPGEYEILVGSSSRDIRLGAQFTYPAP